MKPTTNGSWKLSGENTLKYNQTTFSNFDFTKQIINNTTRWKIICCILVFNFFTVSCWAQTNNWESAFVGIGLGINANRYLNGVGAGLNYRFGAVKQMKNENFRYVPSLQIGFYDGKHDGDEPDLFLNSTQLSVAVHCDFIRFKKWSILLGTGTSFHHLRGLQGRGGISCCVSPDEWSNRHFTGINLALNGVLGLRINPKKTWSIELILINLGYSPIYKEHELGVLQTRIHYIFKPAKKDQL